VVSEPLDLEPIKARLAARRAGLGWFVAEKHAITDLAALIAEVERLREKYER
jgi:hypothetical protein